MRRGARRPRLRGAGPRLGAPLSHRLVVLRSSRAAFDRALSPGRSAVSRGYNKSILLGIQVVNARIRSGRLKVSSSCRGLIREAGLYRYPTPEERRLLNTENPLDQDNHSASALRYLVCGLDRTALSRAGAPPMRMHDMDSPPEEEPVPKPKPNPKREEPPPSRPAWYEPGPDWETVW